MILNLTKAEAENELAKGIEIDGTLVERASETKLLGIIIDDKQNWKEHFSGANGLVKALNKRTFCIRRIRNQLPRKELIKVVQSLWMSRLRYGLQLCNQVRANSTDTENQNMKAAQTAQNKMLRMMEGVSLKEHVTSLSLRQKYNIPSVNQLAGEIKLMEAWKSVNIHSYPFQMEENEPNRQMTERSMRPNTVKKWKDSARTKAAKESMSIDCARLWNNAPTAIHNARTKTIAKSAIKKYARTLEN